MTSVDLFNLLAASAIVLMAVILAMVDKDRAHKNESLRLIWSRRSGFGAGVATMLYGSITHDLVGACILMTAALNGILAVNVVAIIARNQPPLHGQRLLRRAGVAHFWKRYP